MNTEKDSKTKKFAHNYAQAGPYLTAGTQFAASIILCLLGGWWLDGKLATTPLFLVLGTFLGAVAGFYNLYKTLTAGEKKKADKEKGIG
jgi:ATP synthase protein I